MKKLIALLFSFISIYSFSQFYTPISPGVYPARINSFATISNMFIANQTRSDTVKVIGTTNGWYLGQVSGTDINHPFVIYVQGKQTINGGIALENCRYVKILAPDSVILTNGGTNGAIKGHADYIQVSGTINLNGVNGGWWIKTEGPDACSYSNPDDYLYPNHMRDIWFTDFRFGNPDGSNAVGGEAIYAGSTGSYGRDPIPCKGGAIYKPMWMNGIHILNGKIFNPGRTGIQLSGADSGLNEIKNVIVINAGRELNSTQGAGIRTGYGTNNQTEIAYNNVKNSYIYNYDLETGCYFHDNVGDSAGYWKQTKNPQQIPSLIASAALSNSTLILKNNTMGVNSASPATGFAIYGGSKYANNNVACNNMPAITVLSTPFNYTSNCNNTTLNKDTFGFWGYQDATSTDLNVFNPYNIQGIHELIQWRDIRPKPDSAYNWTALISKVDSAINRNIYCSIQINVGQGSPQWVLDSVGSFMTVGVPAQPGPYPRYYNPKYRQYYNQLLKDIGSFLASLSSERLHHIIFWQVAEGSTGDGQPYKGVLDSCQVVGGCTAFDSSSHHLGDPYVPQDRFEFAWEKFRRDAWDTAAKSSGYQAVANNVALMFNTGNSGNDLAIATSDSASDSYDDDNYLRGHFAYLPIRPWVKSGTLSHIYSFRGELSHFQRIKTPDRGEVQGYIKLTPHPHKELFTLICSALTGDLHMLNGDQSWVTMKETGEVRTDPRISDFFTLMTNSDADGFLMPAFKVDYGDTVTYPTSIFGALINPDPVQQYKFERRLYNYQLQSNQYGSGDDFDAWQYWKAVDAFINPARKAAIDALYPQAAFGNMQDSMWWNDHVINAAYNYEKNLHQINATTSTIPVYRVGPDTALYGRFACMPKLNGQNKCSWKFDIDNKLMKTQRKDSIQIMVTYLDNNSGGSFSIGGFNCGKKTLSSTVIVNTNSGLFKQAVFDIPKFRFKPNGYDFSIDFIGSVTIGFVQIKNLSKQ